MKVFVSYSRRDDAPVKSLVADLQRARQQVWLDEDLGGGEAWWTQILEQVRECAVFVLALSNNALSSKPCRAEFDYAKALGLPILPVQIGEVASYRDDPIFAMQLVDYRNPTRDSAIALISALHERAARRGELPDPLPEPPPIPYAYLQRLGAAIHGPAELAPQSQMAMVFELRGALGEESDDSVRDDIRNLLLALRARKEVTFAIATEIDAILASQGGPPAAESTRAEGQPTTIAAASASQAPATPAKEAAVPFGAGGAGPPPSTHPAESAPTTTTADGRTGSIRPTDTTPRPEQAPLFQRLNRRTKIVFAAVALFVVVACVVAILLVSHKSTPSSSQVVLPFTGLNYPSGVAVDGAGNVYVTDWGNKRVLKLAAGASTPTELPFTGLNRPSGVAVDGTGTVYVTDPGTVYVTDSVINRVLKLAVGASTPTELPFTGLSTASVAVDSAGTVFVVDDIDKRVLKLAAGATTPTELPFTGLIHPTGVAVDSAGTVYVADRDNRVLKLPAGASTPTELPFTGLNRPSGVAVDGAGTVYVTDWGNKQVLKLAAGASAPTELPLTGLNKPSGVAVDGTGNVYVTDAGNNRVLKLAG